MAKELIRAEASKQSPPSKQLSAPQGPEEAIMAALAKMAILRNAAPGPQYLQVMAESLLKEPLPLVLRALDKLARSEPGPYDPPLPCLGRIIREIKHVALF